MLLEQRANLRLHRPGGEIANLQRRLRAVFHREVEPVALDVEREHVRAHGRRDLRGEAADAADADHRRDVAGQEAAAAHGLERGRDRVGDHAELPRLEAFGQAVERNQRRAAHELVRGKSAVDVVARHLLLGTGVAAASFAEGAPSTRQHRGDEHQLTHCGSGSVDGCDAADHLVPEHQRSRLSGGHLAAREAEIGVAEAAADHLDQRVAGRGLREAPPLRCERPACLGEDVRQSVHFCLRGKSMSERSFIEQELRPRAAAPRFEREDRCRSRRGARGAQDQQRSERRGAGIARSAATSRSDAIRDGTRAVADTA